MYPLKSNFKKGDSVTSIGAEWFNTVANVLNNLSIQGGTIDKDVYGLHWTIVPAIAGGVVVTVLDAIVNTAGTITFSRKKLIVLAEEDTTDATQTFTELTVEFLKVTSLDVNGCPDAFDWRTVTFLITADVDSTIDA